MSLLSFSLHNPVGVLLVVVPMIANIGILIAMFRRGSQARVARIFTIFVLMLLAWQLFDVAVRAATNLETAQAWRDLLRSGQFFAIATGVHFALHYARQDRLADSLLVQVALYLPAFIAQALYAAGLVTETIVDVPTWGWIADNSDTGALFDSILTVFAVQSAAIPGNPLFSCVESAA